MSAFKAFLSDDESDAGAPAVAKPKAAAPKPKAAAPAKAAPAKAAAPAKKPQEPKAVATKSNDKPARKPNNTMEPSEKPAPTGDAHRGRGRGRGVRPGDRNDRGKRIFDKHSGTGRDRGAKKSGAGGHNWGTDVDPNYNTNVSISIDNEHSAQEIEAAAKLATSGVEAEETKPEETEDETPKEPEKETFSLDEYFKKKAEKRSGAGFESISEVKVEKLSEGKEYAKKGKNDAETDVFIKFGTDDKKAEKKRGQGRANQRKAVEDLGFKVKNPDQERSFRGGRGGRGGFRGRGDGLRGRGGARGGRGGRGPRVDTSEQSFPQLGASS